MVTLGRLSLVTALVCGAGAARAQPEVTAAVRTTVAWDDNVLLGRRGQFLGALAAEAGGDESDVAVRQRLHLALASRAAATGDRAVVSGRVEVPLYRAHAELTSLDAQLVLGADQRVGDVTVSPGLGLRIHRERPEWSWRTVEPTIAAVTTFGRGLRLLARYRFTAQQFATTAGGDELARTSYANVDFHGHLAELDLRQWLGSSLRVRLLADLRSAWFDGNTAPTLADYAALAPGETRFDQGGGVQIEALVDLGGGLLLNGGVRGELSDSNSEAFTFRSARGIAGLLFSPGRHALYAGIDYGVYDFPRSRFDQRYTDTRVDFRREVDLVYRFAFDDTTRVAIAVRRDDAVSNDCADFDPERDADGLPVTSRSYSCFGRTRAEAFVEVEL